MPEIHPNCNSDIFEDPMAFRPERWETASKEMLESMMMFSLGKHNCVGQSLATAELNSAIPRLQGNIDFFPDNEICKIHA